MEDSNKFINLTRLDWDLEKLVSLFHGKSKRETLSMLAELSKEFSEFIAWKHSDEKYFKENEKGMKQFNTFFGNAMRVIQYGTTQVQLNLKEAQLPHLQRLLEITH